MDPPVFRSGIALGPAVEKLPGGLVKVMPFKSGVEDDALPSFADKG